MNKFNVGDKCIITDEEGVCFRLGETVEVTFVNAGAPSVFRYLAKDGDGVHQLVGEDQMDLIEKNPNSIAQGAAMIEVNKAEILRRMEKIRKHLAKIEELMSDKTPDEAQAEAKEALWYPLVPEGFGPWIEYDGSGMPVDANAVTNVLARVERMTQDFNPWGRPAKTWDWQHNSPEASKEHDIIAYCVKK